MSPEWNGTLYRLGPDSSFWIAIVAVIVALILITVRVRSSGVLHAAWSAVLCAMLLMPVLPYCVPSISIPVPAAASGVVAPPEIPATTPQAGAIERREVIAPALAPMVPEAPAAAASPAQGPMWPGVALAVYGIGVLALVSRLLPGWRSVARIARTKAGITLDAAISPALRPSATPVHESGLVAASLTVGIFFPQVIPPVAWRQWPAEKLNAVLAHELAHVRRRDPLIGMLAHLNRCIFWFIRSA